ncbi:MAG: transcriptional regulator [Epsilonproteobacteria bacterium]|nr:MAG: transcriptional regulator [Campylobacterota bacterium]
MTLFSLEIGSTIPSTTLEGDNGGKLDGSAFSSHTLRDKVHVIFYVDPDEKDLNNPLSDALKAEAFDRSKYGSVAIINMDATWLPNFAIASSLEEKQEKFPDTLYVKDLQKVLVEQWDIADDNSDIIILDKNGNVLYVYEGKLDEEQISTVIALVKENI